jgi:hypothetical protein
LAWAIQASNFEKFAKIDPRVDHLAPELGIGPRFVRDPFRFLTTDDDSFRQISGMQDHLAHRLAAREHFQGVGGLRQGEGAIDMG